MLGMAVLKSSLLMLALFMLSALLGVTLVYFGAAAHGEVDVTEAMWRATAFYLLIKHFERRTCDAR